MGESYGGKYASALTALLSRERNNYPMLWKNLKGVAIGDGLFDPAIQASTWASFGVNVGIMDALVSNSNFRMWDHKSVCLMPNLLNLGSKQVEWTDGEAAHSTHRGRQLCRSIRVILWNYYRSHIKIQRELVQLHAIGCHRTKWLDIKFCWWSTVLKHYSKQASHQRVSICNASIYGCPRVLYPIQFRYRKVNNICTLLSFSFPPPPQNPSSNSPSHIILKGLWCRLIEPSLSTPIQPLQPF